MRISALLALAACFSFTNADITVKDIQAAYAALDGGKPDVAAKLLKKLVDECPENANYWGDYGRALLESKQFDLVPPVAERAASLGYYPWRAYYGQAIAYANLGDKEKTLESMQKALDARWYGGTAFGSEKVFDLVREEHRFKRMIGADFDRATISRDEGWRRDLDYLLKEARRQHFDFDARFGTKAIDDFAKKLKRDIPKLKDHEVIVGLFELMAMGGDGHTWVLGPQESDKQFRTFPIQIFSFKEGLYVTAATEAYKHLNGLRLVKIDGVPVAKAIDQVRPTISGETPVTVLSRIPRSLTTPEILHAKKVIRSMEKAPFEFVDSNGKTVVAELVPVPQQPAPTLIPARKSDNPPLYLKDRARAYWYEYQPDSKLLYVQYNAVRNISPVDSQAQFWPKVFKFGEDNDVEAMVIDIRWNGGGNLFLNDPLLNEITASKKFNQTGKLFVITGRGTYSAAASLVGRLDRTTSAIFVGEPAGASPNFVGENSFVVLPYSGLRASISALFWQNTHAMDRRIWVGPDISAPPTWELFIQNRDPAMEAILRAIRN